MIHAVLICLAFGGCRFEDVDIHARYLDGRLCVIDRLTEEVVGTHRAGDVIARTIIAPRLVVFFCKLHRNFELGQDIAFHVEGNFRGVHRSGAVAHKGAQMIGAEVHLIGERELRGGHAEAICRCALFENLVATRVFHLEGKVTVPIGPVTGAIQRERADMDRLAGLVDRLLGGEHNQCRVFDLDGLGVFGGTDGRVGDEADIVCASERSRKAKLSGDRAVLVEAPGEERASSLRGE